MKKGLKIGLMSLLVLGTIVISAISSNEAYASKKIKVTLTSSNPVTSCNDIPDFEYTGTVSSGVQTLGPKSQDLVCTFSKTGAENVTVLSSALSGPQNIAASNVLLTTNSSCKTQAGVAATTCKALSSVALSGAQTVMSKAANSIGTATHTLNISVKVPAYTPQGSYEGTLTITW